MTAEPYEVGNSQVRF